MEDLWCLIYITARIWYNKKRQVNKANKLLKLKKDPDIRDNKKYKIETICDSKIYAKKVLSQLLKLYYLVF